MRGVVPSVVIDRNRGFIYDPTVVPEFDPRLFSAAFWREQGLVRDTATGRGAVQFVEWHGNEWVLRRYRRGGMPGKLIEDRYVWLGPNQTRCFREWRVLHELYSNALPVPRPIAAGYERLGLTYCADLITERLRGTVPLSKCIGGAELPAERWFEIGRTIRRFHERRLWHADLNAHNILLRPGGEIFLIDFDRARFREPGPWQETNLERLLRSLRKITTADPRLVFGKADWDVLLQGYSASE